jgi:dTDP-4-amino-4,6-dideoxygalactose transaminase
MLDKATQVLSKISFVDLKPQFESIRTEITAAVMQTLESQRFILGPEVEAFEKEMAAWNGSAHAIACASGSDALLLALMGLGIGPGDEVITTPFTFVATVTAIVRLGATPVFVDVDPVTFNLDPAKLQAAITDRTRAIIPIHLFGFPADLDPICALAQDRGIDVIEDAAQAIGAKYKGRMIGNIGKIGCFSFFPSKNLGCGGDGGLITTSDPELADKLRVLATHGSRARYRYELIGINSRLDAIQAAILRVKLPHLGRWTEGRRRNAELYRRLLTEAGVAERIALPAEPAYGHHVYNQFTIRYKERDSLRSHLLSRGVPTEIYYPHPLHSQPAFAYLGYGANAFPEAMRASQEVLSLPIYPELPVSHVEEVVNALAEYFE